MTSARQIAPLTIGLLPVLGAGARDSCGQREGHRRRVRYPAPIPHNRPDP